MTGMEAFFAAPLIGSGASAITVGGALSGASTVLGLAGAISQYGAMQQGAKNAEAAAEANRRQLEYQAGQEAAAGQHKAEQDRRKSALMLSRAQAVAAASGGGPLDESLMRGIVGEGEKQAGYTMYTSTERAKGLQYRGAVGEWEAGNQAAQMRSAANATLIGGFAKAGMGLADRFAPGPAPGVSSGFGYGDPAYDLADL